MACFLAGAKPLSEPCWNTVNWTPGNKLQWNLNWNLYVFIQENAFEIVVRKFVAILSRPQCVKGPAGVSGMPSTWSPVDNIQSVLFNINFFLSYPLFDYIQQHDEGDSKTKDAQMQYTEAACHTNYKII